MHKFINAIGWLGGAIALLTLLSVVGVGIYNSGKMLTHSEQQTQPVTTVPNHKASTTPLKQLTPLAAITRTSAPPQTTMRTAPSNSDYLRKVKIHRSLQDTCNKWTGWYNRDHSENARINMNISCRDAEHYARTELKRRPSTANHVAKQRQSSDKKSATRILISSSKKQSAYQCQAWEAEKERIQDRLRAGYRENTGNRLRARRRELSDLIYANC